MRLLKHKSLYSQKPAVAVALCMLAVVLLSLTGEWMVFAQTDKTVRTQQESLVERSLQLTLQKLDTDIQQMSGLAVRMRRKMRLVDMPEESAITAENRLSFYEARQSLKEFYASAPSYIEGVYLARNGADYAVTSSSVTSLAGMAKGVWNNDVTAEDLWALHAGAESGKIVRVGKKRLAYVLAMGTGSRESLKGRAVVLMLAPGYLNNLAREYGLPGAQYALCDASGNVLLSQQADTADKTAYARPLAQGGYMLRAWIPSEFLSGGATSLRLLYLSVLGVTLLASALMIILLSRRTALPVNQLVAYIQKNYRVEDDAEGLSLVFHAVERMLDEHEAHIESLERYRAQAEMRSLADALMGRGDGRAESGRAYVVACFARSEEEDAETLRAALQDMALAQYEIGSAVVGHAVYLLLEKQSGAMNENEAEHALEALLQRLDDGGAQGARCGMSMTHLNTGEIEAAYREAGMAADCLDKHDMPILRFDMIRYAPEYFLRDWRHLDKQLAFADCMWHGDIEGALQALDELFPEEFLRSPHTTLAQLHLASLKYQFLHDADSWAEDLPDADELSRTISRQIILTKTHGELKALMKRLLVEMDGRSDKAEQDQDETVRRVKAYIRQHAADKQLSVTAVAEAFGMPINRLSKLFSRCTGVGVLQYIHKIRIEEACTLLLTDESMTIADVAAQVGYTSTLTFTRAFKARYHMTPGEYRRLHASD